MIDVAIIGGSFAGLTAALQLGRASRTVTVIDAGATRNRMSPAAHGVPGWDGIPPQQILERIKEDVAAYPTVSFIGGEVVKVTNRNDAFKVGLGSGQIITARRILLAHGVRDILPDLPGAAEAWGKTLLHCPYCHGYEVKGRPLAVLGLHPMAGHQAAMLRADWSDDVTLLTGTGAGALMDAPVGITVDARPISALKPGTDGLSVVFEDDAETEFGAVFSAPRVSLTDTPAEMLGCATSNGPLGPFVLTGPMGQTSVPGVFAAGDCATPMHSVTAALGAGAIAGAGCHQSNLFPDNFPPLEVSEP